MHQNSTVLSRSAQSLIDENMISTDAGNGWTACYCIVGGKLKQHGIPHMGACVAGSRLNAEYADFCRQGYGDGIWNLTDTPIDLPQNTARGYGWNLHIFLMLVNIAALGMKSGSELTVIVPAPPGLLNQIGPQLKQSILAGENGSG